MPENIEPSASVKRLRFKFAINYFKSLLLGDKHVSGRPQSESVLDAINDLSCSPPLSERAWHDWFFKDDRIPQPGKIEALDRVATALSNADRSLFHSPGILPNGFFKALVHGGLMDSLLAPTKSKNILHTLIGRANDYEPLTPIHLHFDAIEAASWIAGFKDLPWVAPVTVAAQRVLELLDERWSPRHGSLYATFKSDLRIQWDMTGPQERAAIRDTFAGWRPDPFERLMRPGAAPNWMKTGCDPDIAPNHIYKLLFGLAADPGFLVEDRLHAWALDLSTASLAMHALAWTDRYNTMAHQVTDELLYWGAFHDIFFNSAPLEADSWNLLPAMMGCNANWDAASAEVFQSAREIYRRGLSGGGTSAEEVISVAMQARTRYPLVYI